jgi:hypothetical protein
LLSGRPTNTFNHKDRTMHERPSQATTDVAGVITDLDGGQFDAMLSVALSKTAANVVDHGKKGEVTIKLKLEPIKGTHQVRVAHSVEFKHPTALGKSAEVAEGATVLHVGKGGAMSLAQPDLFDNDTKGSQSRIPGA